MVFLVSEVFRGWDAVSVWMSESAGNEGKNEGEMGAGACWLLGPT